MVPTRTLWEPLSLITVLGVPGGSGEEKVQSVSVKLTSGGRNPRDLIEVRFLSSTLEDKVGHFILHLCGPL